MKWRSSDRISKYSTSEADPIAISRKRAKPLSEPGPQLSAIVVVVVVVVGTEALALLIWEISPYFLVVGKLLVALDQ